MKKVIILVIVSLFLLCSCNKNETASTVESNYNTISSKTTSTNQSIQPWYRNFYVEDFTYSSIDEFCRKISENGSDELFERCPNMPINPYGFDSKRRENISNILNNCIYEMYYKGEKIEPHELIGFNVHVGREDKGEYTGAPSYCEYFVKFKDSDYKASYVAHVRFYEMSRVKKYWDEFLQNPIDTFGKRFTAIKLPLDGKEVNGVVSCEYDPNTNDFLARGTWICFEYTEDVIIFIDFAPNKTTESYASKVDKKGYSYEDIKTKLQQEFAIYDVPPIFDNEYTKSFLGDFVFEKISIITSDTEKTDDD